MIGKTISHYKILEKLGEGSMGKVYKAEDAKLKREVALKFLPKEFSRDPKSKERFISEARTASVLDHNNVCVIHDINETDDSQLFIIMSYYRGETLQEKLKQEQFSVDDTLNYINQIASGLEAAHKKQIVHCDIKPGNILITEDGVAKIVDFGIARVCCEVKLESKNNTSGTLAYMSPEQVGGSDFDDRTDIWSLGVLFYEMLTMQLPFQDNYNEALMYSIVNEQQQTIAKLNPDIPIEIEQIVNKMLNKNPDDRYQQIGDLLTDLKNYKRQQDLPPILFKTLNNLLNSKYKNWIYRISAIILLSLFLLIGYFTIIRTQPVPSIGILNMENLGDPEDEFWSRGITEDLIVSVASAGIIRVPTINEMNKYTGLDFSVKKIAEKLRVDYLLSSSLFKKDSTFDLWCRIIDPKTGKDIFARKWSKPIHDASSITNILAGTVLNNLGIPSDITRQVPVIVDPDAYEYYLKGKNIWETRQNNDDILLSRGLLQQALKIDENFLQAKIQLGQSYTGTADYDQALSIFNECLDSGKKLNNEKVIALAMLNIGNINLYKYQLEGATYHYKNALKITRKHSDKYNEAKLLRNIGSSHYWQNNYKKAKEYYNESRLISVMLDDKLGEAESLFNLGSIFLETMEYKEAMRSYKELYDIFDSINNKSQMGYALNGISYSYMGIGEIDSALVYANASLESAREISDKQNELNSLINLGEINYCIGNNEKSMEIFMQSIELTNDINDVYYSGISNQYLGLLMLRDNNYHEAMNYFEIADIKWKILKDPTHEVWTNSAWALAAQRAGEISVAAREILRTESILARSKPYEDFAMCVYYNLYNYYAETGDTSLVKKYLSYANNEMLKRLKYIGNQKDKNDFLNRIVEYGEINNLYKKYFD